MHVDLSWITEYQTKISKRSARSVSAQTRKASDTDL